MAATERLQAAAASIASAASERPVDQAPSQKGGLYSHGPFTSHHEGQFGVVNITDDGGPTIEVTFTGRRAGSAIPGATYHFMRAR